MSQEPQENKPWNLSAGPRAATTWRELITAEMNRFGERLDEALAVTRFPPSDPEVPATHDEGNWLDVRFENSHGTANGHSFRLWTPNRVYFSHVYDGEETCRSVPRHPETATAEDRTHVEQTTPKD